MTTAFYSVFAYDQAGQLIGSVSGTNEYLQQYYSVFAFDEQNNYSQASTTVIARPIIGSGDIVTLYNLGSHSLQAAWTPVPNALNYHFVVGDMVLSATSPEAMVTGLPADTAYTVIVRARDHHGNVIFESTPVEIRTKPERFVTSSIGPQAIVHATSYQIKWMTIPEATYYHIYNGYFDRKLLPSAVIQSNPVLTQYVYSNNRAAPNTRYLHTLVAYDVDNNVLASYEVSLLTLPAYAVEATTVLVAPNDGWITADNAPKFYWQVPDGEVGKRFDFILEVAEDRDFTKNVRRFNSFESKDGFSFNSPREANSKEIVYFEPPDPLVKY